VTCVRSFGCSVAQCLKNRSDLWRERLDSVESGGSGRVAKKNLSTLVKLRAFSLPILAAIVSRGLPVLRRTGAREARTDTPIRQSRLFLDCSTKIQTTRIASSGRLEQAQPRFQAGYQNLGFSEGHTPSAGYSRPR